MGATTSLDPDIAQAFAALEALRAYGVEDALDEVAIDRFAAPAPAPVALPTVVAADPAPRPAAPTGDQLVMEARRRAAQARTLDELRALLEGFDGCGLKATATRTVFADGTPGAPVMLVGEAPGREEDLDGRPFVGRSGQLLDRMLAAIGLDRSGVYIANVVPWRPPGNRTPTPQEIALVTPFIGRQIELARPKLLVILGGAAASALLGTSDGIKRLRGRWLAYETPAGPIRALATFHPAFLLRQPIEKRAAWRDLLMLKAALEER